MAQNTTYCPWVVGGLVAKLCLTFENPWTVALWMVACQATLSMGFCRQEYWSGLPFPSSGDLLDPGIEPRSLALHVNSLLTESPRKPPVEVLNVLDYS